MRRIWAIRLAFIADRRVRGGHVVGRRPAGRGRCRNGWREIAMRPMDTQHGEPPRAACVSCSACSTSPTPSDFDLPRMFSYLGEKRWAAPWGRGQLGGWDAFLRSDAVLRLRAAKPDGAADRPSRLHSVQTWVSIVLSGVMLAFLSQGGGRRIIGVTVGAAILVWIQAQPDAQGATADDRRGGGGRPADGDAVHAEHSQRRLRRVLLPRRQSEYDYLHVDDNFLRLAQVIEIVPAEHPHVGYQQLWFTIVRPVPRVFWPGKPVDPGFDLPSLVGHEGRQPVDVDHRRVVFELRLARRRSSAAGCTADWRGRPTSCASARSTAPTRSSTDWPSWSWSRACARCRTWSS